MRTLLLVFFFLPLVTKSQETLDARDQLVVKGKLLASLEQSSWAATDLFFSKNNGTIPDTVGGYFSYKEGTVFKCIFYCNDSIPHVIATITFSDNIDAQFAKTSYKSRNLSTVEKEYWLLRKSAEEVITNDKDFNTYARSKTNLIPLLGQDTNEVYMLTGSEKPGEMLLGNDYKYTFSKKNVFLKKTEYHSALHKFDINDSTGLIKIIPIPTNDRNYETLASAHVHANGESDYITETDICTLILYGKSNTWRRHAVISKNYISIWDCKNKSLEIIPR